ncbi:uncharacterized protein EV420DRAFT_1613921 [Desarmillaria tabescens]|uniref:Uncharacterized protein n=1 Tax=Armillaria tabescens TaxID=1929756 RepID=A0AA39IUH4_ARMTA|nr:uncharacterized protein EV420DRAFT_1613921 [Desarmillaria tabescens]KAK0430717.1 hypothetical protein EV420DRAFT_1613921 [Desarmillaria tabescens]
MYILATVAPRCRLMQPCLSLMICFLLCCLNRLFSSVKSFRFDLSLHKLPSAAIPTLLYIFQHVFSESEAVIYAKHLLLPLRLPEESFFETLSPVEQALACVVIAPTGWGKTLCLDTTSVISNNDFNHRITTEAPPNHAGMSSILFLSVYFIA